MKLKDKLKVLFGLPIECGEVLLDGWTEKTKLYWVWCDSHGWFKTHVSGHNESFLCLTCLKESYGESDKLRLKREFVKP